MYLVVIMKISQRTENPQRLDVSVRVTRFVLSFVLRERMNNRSIFWMTLLSRYHSITMIYAGRGLRFMKSEKVTCHWLHSRIM